MWFVGLLNGYVLIQISILIVLQLSISLTAYFFVTAIFAHSFGEIHETIRKTFEKAKTNAFRLLYLKSACMRIR